MLLRSRTRRLGPFIALVALLLVAACSKAEPSTNAAEPTSTELAAAIQEHAGLISDFDQVRAILVARGGRTVYSEYFGTDADAYWGLQSVTKSIVSTLVGIARDEGLIVGLDATLAELLPEHVTVMSQAVRTTTLRQLLTMSGGFAAGLAATGPEFTSERHWVRAILAHPETPPGQAFVYSNGTSHLLAAIVEEATGMSVLAFARSRLFGPLGIDSTPAHQPTVTDNEALKALDEADFAWPVDPQGTSTGWFGLRLRPEDLLKIGQLFLGDGRWDGRQVVSTQWVADATTQQVEVDSTGLGYGYQWWTGDLDGETSYRAIGYGGELIVVVPSRDLVVVTATELRQADVTSRGIDTDVLLAIIEDAVVSQFGSD
jgi:CubicO group peptidase (beta-lactamase class C family)